MCDLWSPVLSSFTSRVGTIQSMAVGRRRSRKLLGNYSGPRDEKIQRDVAGTLADWLVVGSLKYAF